MFSILFNSAKAFLGKITIKQDSYNYNQPAEQLQVELSNSVREGMVTTRRQSHGLPNEQLMDSSEIDTPKNMTRKRKNEKSDASTTLVLPAKRRKTSLKPLDHDGQSPTGTSVPTTSERQRPTVQVVIAVNSKHESHDRDTQSLNSDVRQPRSKQKRLESGKRDDGNTSGIKPGEQPVASQGKKGGTHKTQHNQDDQLAVEASDFPVRPDSKTTRTAGISTAPKATHFRFGNDEPDVVLKKLDNGHTDVAAQFASVSEKPDESDAEDEAPEIITASVGAATARARNIEADRAAERHRATVKEKRRERNDILRQQAQRSKKAKRTKVVETPEDESEHDDLPNSWRLHLESVPSHAGPTARRPLPALLPDDILAADPVTRSLTPPLDQKHAEKPKRKKHIFVETAPKPPKDIKRGPVKIRVLEGGRQNLPPKASKESRNMKESWLVGRRGRNGAAVMERRKIGLGFTRR